MKLTITSVSEQLYNDDAYSVNCPGTEGEFTVLSDHVPFISLLKEGKLRVRKTADGDYIEFDVSNGFIEVSHNEATILI